MVTIEEYLLSAAAAQCRLCALDVPFVVDLGRHEAVDGTYHDCAAVELRAPFRRWR